MMLSRFRGSVKLCNPDDFATFQPRWEINQVIVALSPTQFSTPFIENLVTTLNLCYVDQLCCSILLSDRIPQHFYYVGSQKDMFVFQRRLVCAELTGGLGNRLFQMAVTYWYALVHHRTAIIAENKVGKCQHSSIDYNITIFQHFPLVRLLSEGDIDLLVEKPEHFSTFINWPHSEKPVVLFRGYFQSKSYILPCFRAMIQLPPIPETQNVFLHVRRGDYVKNSFHYINLRGYYLDAIKQKFDQLQQSQQIHETKLLICSNDIEWCKKQWFLQTDLSIYLQDNEGDSNNELKTLAHMAACKKGGICSNSTFSWWGAWLNGGESYIPSKWLSQEKWNTEFETTRIKCIDVQPGWNVPVEYINLHHRLDRKKQVEVELQDKLNIPGSYIERFEAVFVPRRGHLGCAASHVHLLQRFLNEQKHLPAIAIIEDDFEVISSPASLQGFLMSEDLEDDFHGLLFGGGCIVEQEDREHKEAGKFANKLVRSQETVGYIVTRRGAQQLLKLWQHEMVWLANPNEEQHSHCIDQSWQQLHEKGKWYIIKPLLCRQRVSYSDIEKRVK